MEMNYLIGMGKSEITPFVIGAGMMGYGQPHNTVKEVGTPLFARTLLISNSTSTVVLVNLEICFVTIAIKDQVIERLKTDHPDWNLNHANVLITAQHTHSAPGGYSHYPLYNFTVPGFSPSILKTIVDGIIKSIEEARAKKKVSTLSLSSIEIPEKENVAFNRSMSAYLANPEAKGYHPTEEWHLAVDRVMNGFKIETDNKLSGLFTWFAVHCTSVSSFNHRIHHDNKGVASETFEKKNPGVTAVFAQSAAGDVTPNFVYDNKLKRTRGIYADQYESAAFNGEIQANYAQRLVENNNTKNVTGDISFAHSYVDMKKIAAAPAHGVAFFKGTIEAPGFPESVAKILRVMASAAKVKKLLFDRKNNEEFYRHQGNKSITVDHRNGEFLGIPLSFWKKLPQKNPDPIVAEFIRQAKGGALKTLPWVPDILPLQLFRFGDVVIAGVPGEITYIAGERLKNLLKKEFQTENIIISSYANAYMGYITTPEEYQVQCYEGGHTVYGKMTLEAIMQGFLELSSNLKRGKTKDHKDESVKPTIFPEKELKLRSCPL